MKKVLTLVLCAAIMMNCLSAVAIERTPVGGFMADLLETALESETVEYYASADAYFRGQGTRMTLPAANLHMETDSETVIMHLVLPDKTLHFTGELLGAEDAGYYSDKMVLGEFAANGGYNVAMFKALFYDNDGNAKKDSGIFILLEKVNSGELLSLHFSLTLGMFAALQNAAMQGDAPQNSPANAVGLNSDAAKERVLSAFNPSRRFMAANNVAQPYAFNSEEIRSTDSNTGVGVTHTTLKRLIQDVQADEVVPVTNIVLQDLLCQEGWSFYKTSSHAYVSYGAAVSDKEYAITISLASVSNRQDDPRTLVASYQITGCITLTYDSIMEEATLMFSGAGISLEDVTFAIELVGGTTMFSSADRMGDFTGGSGLTDLACAIFDDLGSARDIWNALFVVPRVTSNHQDFGSAQAQIDRYGGPIRAIANQANGGFALKLVGDRIGIEGVYMADGTYSSHRVAYMFTASSIL